MHQPRDNQRRQRGLQQRPGHSPGSGGLRADYVYLADANIASDRDAGADRSTADNTSYIDRHAEAHRCPEPDCTPSTDSRAAPNTDCDAGATADDYPIAGHPSDPDQHSAGVDTDVHRAHAHAAAAIYPDDDRANIRTDRRANQHTTT
jgi:hypothetical protein